MDNTRFPPAGSPWILPQAQAQAQDESDQGAQVPASGSAARRASAPPGRGPQRSRAASDSSSERARHGPVPRSDHRSVSAAFPSLTAEGTSTVSRLATAFDASTLLAASIRCHNPQDFSGPPLPSGDSVPSQTWSTSEPRPSPAAGHKRSAEDCSEPPRAQRARFEGYPQAASPLSRAQEHALVPQADMSAGLEAAEALRRHLASARIHVLRNDGAGGNLCLVMALVQNTECPPQQWEERSLEVAADLLMRGGAMADALSAGHGVHADRDLLQPLAERIFAPHRVPQIVIVRAGPGGSALLVDPLRNHAAPAFAAADIAEDAVVLLESPGHFETLVADVHHTSWAAALAQLQARSPGDMQQHPEVNSGHASTNVAGHEEDTEHHGPSRTPQSGSGSHDVPHHPEPTGASEQNRRAKRGPKRDRAKLDETQQKMLNAAMQALPRLDDKWDPHGLDPNISPPRVGAEQQQLLDSALLEVPRRDGKGIDLHGSDLAHARALKWHAPNLDLPALAKGSGAHLTNVRGDPTINPPKLPAAQQKWLDEALQAVPRFDADGKDLRGSNINHAQALKEHDARLGLAALAKGSGAAESRLKGDSRVNPRQLDVEQQRLLDAALKSVPRCDDRGIDLRGSALNHARALGTHAPNLGHLALAKGSGAALAEIKRDPAMNPRDLEDAEQERLLAAALQEVPRFNESGTDKYRSALKYARALHAHASTLGIPALAKGSGATEAHLRQDPTINPSPLGVEQQRWLDEALQLIPRYSAEGEDLHGSGIKHARALHVHDPRLDDAALSRGSGVNMSDIRRDPQIHSPELGEEQQALLDAALLAVPRFDANGVDVRGSDLAHARDLQVHAPCLGHAALAKGSHASVNKIKNDWVINSPELSPDEKGLLEAALQAVPRRDGDGRDLHGSRIKHARALHAHTPALSHSALAAGSGASNGDIRADPTINPPELAPEQQALLNAALQAEPRFNEKGEDLQGSDMAHARALKAYAPALSELALVVGSGVKRPHIRLDPTINPPELGPEQQALLDAAMKAVPRFNDTGDDQHGSDIAHARALRAHTRALGYPALAKGSGATERKIKSDSQIHRPEQDL